MGESRRAGFFVFVVTNQSGVGRGYYDEADVEALHAFMQQALGDAVDAFRYCPHHPEAAVERYRVRCGCRKPAPGMIENLLAEYPVVREASFLIGDRDTDLAAARAAGIEGVRYIDGSLDSLVERVLQQRS